MLGATDAGPGLAAIQALIAAGESRKLTVKVRVNELPEVSILKLDLVEGRSANRAHSFVALIAEALLMGLSWESRSQPIPIAAARPTVMTAAHPPKIHLRFLDFGVIRFSAQRPSTGTAPNEAVSDKNAEGRLPDAACCASSISDPLIEVPRDLWVKFGLAEKSATSEDEWAEWHATQRASNPNYESQLGYLKASPLRILLHKSDPLWKDHGVDVEQLHQDELRRPVDPGHLQPRPAQERTWRRPDGELLSEPPFQCGRLT